MEEKLSWALRRRADGHATVPSLLMEERSYNPFLRAHVAALRARVAELVRDARGRDMPEVPFIAAVRQLKDAKAHLAHLGSAGGGGGAGAGRNGGGGGGGGDGARASNDDAGHERSAFDTTALDDGAAARGV